jgi:hypothetical protein
MLPPFDTAPALYLALAAKASAEIPTVKKTPIVVATANFNKIFMSSYLF